VRGVGEAEDVTAWRKEGGGGRRRGSRSKSARAEGGEAHGERPAEAAREGPMATISSAPKRDGNGPEYPTAVTR
jgi:hypothetical protein